MSTTTTLSGSNSTLTGFSPGDTIIATGSSATLSGLGSNSLVAAGNGDFLAAGTGGNTLRGNSLTSATSILQGNGSSTLQYAGGLNTILLNSSVAGGAGLDYKTDSIQAATLTGGKIATTGASVIRTTLNKFDLSNTLNHGAGVLNIRNLTYTGTGNATLIGNTLSDYIQGGTSSNSLVAGIAGASTLDAHISSGNNTLVGNGHSSLLGGVGNDTFVISAGDKINPTTTKGTDLVSLTGSSSAFNLSDTLNGAGITNIKNLVYAGTASQVTLTGNALNNSIRGAGGASNNYLSGGSGGSDTLNASASSGSNTLLGNSLSGSSLIGGTGHNTFITNHALDTLSASNSSTNTALSNLATINFSTLKGSLHFDSIIYTGNGNTDIIGNSLGGTTLNAGSARAATIGDGGGGYDNLIGSARGTNLFQVSNLSTDTVLGGLGISTLLVTNQGGYTDSLFANDHKTGALQLTGNSAVTLGGNALAAGISTVIGGTGSDTFISSSTLNGGFTKGLFVDTSADTLNGFSYKGGNGSDTIKVANSTVLNASTITGAAGTNLLEIASGAASVVGLINTINIQELSLSGGNNKVSGIGSSGLTTILGGTGGNDTIDASTATAPVYINESSTTLGDNLTASSTALSTLIGSSTRPNTFNQGSTLADAFTGSSTGNDTLNLTVARSNYSDSLFANDSFIGALQLTSNSAVTLGGNALTAGISTVIGGAGSDTIVSSATLNGGFNKGLFVDTSANTLNGFSYTGGNGADTIKVANSTVLNASTITGASGTNLLEISTGNASITGLGNHVSSIQELSLAGGNNKVSGIASSGITTILGGTGGNDTIDASTATSPVHINESSTTLGDNLTVATVGSNTLIGSRLGGNIFNQGNARSETLIGGAGVDTLSLTTAGTYSDALLIADKSIEVLQLTSNSSVTLGGYAVATGISTVIGGAGSDTIVSSATLNSGFNKGLFVDTSANTLNGFSYTGGNGSDTIKVANSTVFNASTITGATGTNFLEIATGNASITGLGSHTSSIQVLSLAGGNNKVSGIGSSGLTTVLGGPGGNDTIDASTSTSSILIDESSSTLGDIQIASTLTGVGSTLIGSRTAANYFQIQDFSSLSGNGGPDSIAPSTSGLDTLALASATTLTDTNLAKIPNGIKALALTSSSSVTLGSSAQSAGILSLFGGIGGDSFTQTSNFSNPLTLVGGAGNDSFNISNQYQIGNDSIAGGTGTDTLALSSTSNLVDTNFAKVSSIDALSLAGNSSVALGSLAAASGFSTIFGGATGSLGDTFTQTSLDGNSLTLIGASGNDSFSIACAPTLGGDSIYGGGGTDTLALGYSGSFNTSTIAGVGYLSLGGTGSDTFDASAYNQAVTLDASALPVASANSLVGSSLGDAFLFSNPIVVNASTVSGGSGSDTLALSAASNLADSSFANITSLEALSLSGASSATLGTNAQTAGFATILGGNGGDTFTQTASDTLSLTLVGGSGNDSFNIANSALLANDSISGVSGNDTIALASSATLNDAFSKVASVEALSLSGSSSVVLGTNAASAGISSLYGGTGSSTLDASTFSKSVLLNASNSSNSSLVGSTLSTTFVGGAGNDTLIVNGSSSNLNAGAGNDLVSLSAASQLTSAILLDGGSGNDTLAIGAGSFNDAFGNTKNFQILQLANGANDTIGQYAHTEGIATVVAANGGVSLNASNFNVPLTLDASTDTVAGGTGSDSFIGSSAFGTDFLSSNSKVLGNSTFTGGSAIDTLQLTAPGTFAATSFAQDSAIEILTLASSTLGTGSSVTFNGTTSGFSTVIAGTNADTFDASAYSSSLTIDASANTSSADSLTGSSAANLFLFSNAYAMGISTLTGEAGGDTLILTDKDTLSDFSFKNFHSIENISLKGGSQILLGDNAQTTGTTLIAASGPGTNSFTQTTADTLHLSLVGGSGTNTFFLYNTGLFANDTIVGSGGINDLLTINDQANLTDASLANLHGVQTISLVGASSAILGSNAQNNGIKAIKGFYGGDVFTTNNTGTSLFGGGAYNFLTSTTTNNWLGGGDLSSSNVTTFNTNTLVGAAYNTLIGGRTTASGSKVNNSLIGNGDNDSIIGNLDNTGNDTIVAYGKSSTIIGGGGSDTIVASNVDDSIKLGNGKASSTSLIEFTTPLNFTSATITGGVGTNTLQIDQPVTLNDQFYNIAANSIDALSLSGASQVALYGVAAYAGITSVYGGAVSGTIGDTVLTTYAAYLQGGTGNDLIVGYYGNDTIVGNGGIDSLYASYASGGNNLFEFTTGTQLAAAYIVSGGSTLDNTVLFTQAGSITDTQLAPLSQIQGISLTGASGITLDSNALNAGLHTVYGGSGNSTLTQTATFTNNLTLIGGSGNDSISIANSALLGNNSIAGGTGTDTLAITSAVTLNNAFSKVSGIEVLSLTGASSVTLGASGESANISTVVGGSSTTLLSAAAYQTTSVKLDNSASGSASSLFGGAATDTLIGGSANDTLQAWSGSAANNSASDTLTGGLGADLFIMAGSGDTKNAYGNGGTNVATITDFAAGAGADKLQLHDFGTGHVGSAGYQTVSGGAGIIDIYTYQDTLAAEHVAHLTGVTGTFSWGNNTSII